MEPRLSIGILSNHSISFILDNGYRCGEHEVCGSQTVTFAGGKILWNGKKYDELLFEPHSKNASFRLKDVVIGLQFHWERKEDQEFQGSLKLMVENGKIRAINKIEVEQYLISVISSEMSPTASLELLKAHAVISRGWLLAQIDKNKEILAQNEKYNSFTETETERIRWYDREDHAHFDVCADDHCQRYQGITRAVPHIHKVRQAVNETRGQVLKSGNKTCDTRFSKCCGGVTEEFQNCWEDVNYPYLAKLRDDDTTRETPDLSDEETAGNWIRARPSAFCNTRDKQILGQVLNNYDRETTDFFRWQVTYTQEELSELACRRSGINFGVVQELIPVQRGTSGRIIKLKVVGSKKTKIIGKELEIRRTLSESHLYSSAFVINKKGSTFILTGAGWGHGVGLCQIGAAVMGEKGYTYQEILLHYYVGASLEKQY